jgi:hypothetical protein
MPAPTTIMRAADVQRLADRLTSSATGNLVEQVAAMQAESRLAASVIRALLRHVHRVFILYRATSYVPCGVSSGKCRLTRSSSS